MSLLANWQARAPKERVAIGLVLSIVLAVLLYAFAWLPMERHRERLTAELPRLRASVAEMRAQAAEVKRLKATPPRTDAKNPLPLAQLVSAGTLAQGLAGAKLTAIDGKRVRLAVDDVAWARLVEWIASAQALHGLSTESARVDALPATGRVRAELVLVAP